MNLLELIWPRLEREPMREAQADAQIDQEIEALRAANWGTSASTILAEAHRLADAEADRRRSADNKAAIYLAAVAAIVPLLASTETVFWDRQLGTAPTAVGLVLFYVALAYLAATGLWAARTLRVAGMTRVDTETLLRASSRTNLENWLASEHAAAVLLSRRAVNEKVTCLKMTHEFMLRAAVAFAVLLATQAGWGLVASLMCTLRAHS